METIMERTGNTVKASKAEAKIPDDVSMLSVFHHNPFINGGCYENDGWVYINNKPIKKWFKEIENISVWFPIFNDLHKLQDRYLTVLKKYQKYLKNKYKACFDDLARVGQAHVNITHKFLGNDDPWWLYTANKYQDFNGISWDWVKTPENPINVEIGTAYYKADQRLEQLSKRVYKFRAVLEYAVCEKVSEIKGNDGQTLQYKLGERCYWFIKNRHTWDKLCFPEDNAIIIEG